MELVFDNNQTPFPLKNRIIQTPITCLIVLIINLKAQMYAGMPADKEYAIFVCNF